MLGVGADKPKVLLVEDDRTSARLATHIIQALGFEFMVADDGVQALYAASTGSFDLILLDLQIPLFSGVEVAEHLSRFGISVPIVVVTASVENLESTLKSHLESLGVIHFMPKPYKRSVFESLVRKFLGEKPQGIGENPITPTQPTGAIGPNEKAKAIVADYIESLPLRGFRLFRSLAQDDFASLAAVAHKLKGAGLFGLGELSALAGRAETIAERATEMELSLGEVDGIRAEVREVLLSIGEQIDQIIARKSDFIESFTLV